MPRVLGPDRNAVEVDVGPNRYKRQKDGTFHVDPITAKLMKREGNFAIVGTKIDGQGFRCSDCNFLALYSDHCGRCGGHSLTAED